MNDERSIDHEWTDFPVCPWCGLVDQDWWDGTTIENDGDKEETECDRCKKHGHSLMGISKSDIQKEIDSLEQENRQDYEEHYHHDLECIKRMMERNERIREIREKLRLLRLNAGSPSGKAPVS